MLHHQMQKGVAIISSDVYQDWGSIISHFEKEMNLIRIKSVVLSDSDADRVVAALEVRPITTCQLILFDNYLMNTLSLA